MAIHRLHSSEEYTAVDSERSRLTVSCEAIYQRQFMTSHVEMECPRREVDCQYCQLSEEYRLIEGQHKEECPKLPISCPNEYEAGSIPCEDMEDHVGSSVLLKSSNVNITVWDVILP